jgi:hypothetical protein
MQPTGLALQYRRSHLTATTRETIILQRGEQNSRLKAYLHDNETVNFA